MPCSKTTHSFSTKSHSPLSAKLPYTYPPPSATTISQHHLSRKSPYSPPNSARVVLAGDSVLHLCVKYYHLEALLQLLNDSELLGWKDSDDNTVLHLAVMLNQFKVVSYLASIPGRKPNELNNIGYTSLDMLEKCPKGFTSLQIEDLLLNIGARRSKDVINPQSTPPPPFNRVLAKHADQSIIRNIFNKCLRYLTVQVDWIAETHGNLMVVATVIATMSFQAVISPPGGVWQQDTATGPSCSHAAVCKAGTAVLAYGDTKEGYTYFSHRNMVSFIASLSVILLHFGGYPLKNRVGHRGNVRDTHFHIGGLLVCIGIAVPSSTQIGLDPHWSEGVSRIRTRLVLFGSCCLRVLL